MNRPRRILKAERAPVVVRPKYRPPSEGPSPRQREANAKAGGGVETLAILAAMGMRRLRPAPATGPGTEGGERP